MAAGRYSGGGAQGGRHHLKWEVGSGKKIAPVVVPKGLLSDTNASSVMLPAKKGTCIWSSSMNSVLPKSLHVNS